MLTTASQNHLVLSQQLLARLRKWTVGREAERFLIHSALRLVKPDATTILFLKLCLEKRNAVFLVRDSQCVLWNTEAQKSMLIGKKFVMKQSSMEEHHKRKLISKHCGKAPERQLSLPRSHSREGQ